MIVQVTLDPPVLFVRHLENYALLTIMMVNAVSVEEKEAAFHPQQESLLKMENQ